MNLQRLYAPFVATVLALAAGLAGAKAPERVVLPGTVIPEHYDLTLTPDAEHLTFSGKVIITLRVKEATRDIVLNALDLNFDKVRLAAGLPSATAASAAKADAEQIPSVSFQKDAQTATLSFAQPIAPGAYTLSINYHGKIFQEASALFALDYADGAGKTQRALFTQFENSDARRFMPSWDEPGRKATFGLTAIVPDAQMAVSNMPVEASDKFGIGMKRVRFQRSPKMSSYLLFFALGDFERIHRQVGKVDVGIIVKRGDAARAQFALDAAAQLLPYYDEYFGTPYPLPKLDLLGGPGSSQFFSAMENWGAIFHFERALLVDPKLSTQAERQTIYGTIAHEMAHMWFGDLVTMAWWDELWLNEGFASWMQNKAAEHFHPEWKVWLLGSGRVQSAMQIDAAHGTHPVVTPILDVEQAGNAFDDITYRKGAAVIRMLEQFVGEDAFRAGVRSYMKEYAYSNTVTDDFWRHIDAASSQKVLDVAHDFTLQAGVPLVRLESARCEGGQQTLALSQGRFAIDDSGKSGAQIWRVPYVVSTVEGKVAASGVLKGKTPVSVTRAGCDPLIINAGQTGYFRVAYERQAFASLLQQLANVPAADQLGLIADTYALAVTGTKPMSDLMTLIDALPLNADPVVWSAAVGRLASLDHYYGDLPGREKYRAYVIQRLQPLLSRLGWEGRTGESDNTISLREDVLQTLGAVRDEGVLAEARKRFAQLRANPSAFSASLRDSVLGILADNADAATWQALHELAKSAPTALEKEKLYGYLSQSAEPDVAQRALELALTDEPPMTIRPNLVRGVSMEHAEAAMSFTSSHWAQMTPLLGPSGGIRFVPRLAQNSNDLAMLDRLEAFRKAHVPPSAAGEYDKAAARIRYNAMVRSRLSEVDGWLAGRKL